MIRPRPIGRGLFRLHYAAARMAAVTTNLRNVLIVGVSAVVAAIVLIAAYRARTPVVSASVVIIISHMHLPSSIGFCIRTKENELLSVHSASVVFRNTKIINNGTDMNNKKLFTDGIAV